MQPHQALDMLSICYARGSGERGSYSQVPHAGHLDRKQVVHGHEAPAARSRAKVPEDAALDGNAQQRQPQPAKECPVLRALDSRELLQPTGAGCWACPIQEPITSGALGMCPSQWQQSACTRMKAMVQAHVGSANGSAVRV